MKYKTSFVTNSSSSSFIITNKTSTRQSSLTLAEELAYLYVEQFDEYLKYFIETYLNEILDNIDTLSKEQIKGNIEDFINNVDEISYSKYLENAQYDFCDFRPNQSLNIYCCDHFTEAPLEASIHNASDNSYIETKTFEIEFKESHQ